MSHDSRQIESPPAWRRITTMRYTVTNGTETRECASPRDASPMWAAWWESPGLAPTRAIAPDEYKFAVTDDAGNVTLFRVRNTYRVETTIEPIDNTNSDERTSR